MSGKFIGRPAADAVPQNSAANAAPAHQQVRPTIPLLIDEGQDHIVCGAGATGQFVANTATCSPLEIVCVSSAERTFDGGEITMAGLGIEYLGDGYA